MGEKCLTSYGHDVLEQRDGDGRGLGGSKGERKEGQERKKRRRKGP